MAKDEHSYDPKTKKVIVVHNPTKRKGSVSEPAVIKDGPLRIFRKKGT